MLKCLFFQEENIWIPVQEIQTAMAATAQQQPQQVLANLQPVDPSDQQTSPGSNQHLRMPRVFSPGGGTLHTLQNIPADQQGQQQQVLGLTGTQPMAIRAQMPVAMAPQVVQIPQAIQQVQTVPVQVPVSQQNGTTVYQTVQMQLPVQQPQMMTALMPQVVQTSAGQQVVMQQVQVQQAVPQFAAQPQFAQIMTPGGQLQQVQVLNGLPTAQVQQVSGGQVQVLAAGGAGGVIPASSLAGIPVQIQQPQMVVSPQGAASSSSGSAATTTTFSTGTTATAASTSTATSESTSSGQVTSTSNSQARRRFIL